MILVDSSVWIDFFRGSRTPESKMLGLLLGTGKIGTGDLILAEVLRGFKHVRLRRTRHSRLCRRFTTSRVRMQPYKNRSGDSGVVAYDIGDGSITVQFSGGDRYLYTIESTGAANIAVMQRLAKEGRGLCSFISRVIRNRYARKLG